MELTALEYKILVMLFENRGKIITREQILSYIWDSEENFVNDNTLTVYIKRIREKIENDPNKPEIIKTVRGLGYKIEQQDVLNRPYDQHINLQKLHKMSQTETSPIGQKGEI